MELLNYTITNPFILLLITFIEGCFISFICNKTSKCTRNMKISLACLPSLVCMALLAINGNIGVSVAILGVFSLVRFRSTPGSSKDIINVFFAMAAGLLTATTYVISAVGLTSMAGIILFIFSTIIKETNENKYVLKILVPETLNFDNLFDDVLEKYFSYYSLEKVKSSNMGTMFELNYSVLPKNNIKMKELLDELRVMNGNLNISYFKDDKDIEKL